MFWMNPWNPEFWANTLNLIARNTAADGVVDYQSLFLVPTGMALAPCGSLFIADTGNRRVSKWARYGQPIALIVAESFEIARWAASLIRVDYETLERIPKASASW